MTDNKKIYISAQNSGQRLDHFLAEKFPAYSRSYFSKLIRNKYVLLNEQPVKSGYILHDRDMIDIHFFVEQSDLSAADIPLDIVFEDEALVVVNKAAGMAVHPGRGTRGDTLVNALLHHYAGNLSRIGDADRPGIVHRLDKYTSGLLVVAKNDQVHRHLRRQFDEHTIHRVYNALVWGSMKDNAGTIHTHIQRSRRDPTRFTVAAKGKEAITHYKVLHDFLYVSLLEVRLDTGRTHQIRVHMQHLHHPVVGDEVYNGRDSQIKQLPFQLQKRAGHLLNLLPHQALHAKKLSFIHPLTGKEVSFECDLPAELRTALDKLPHLFMLNPEA